MNILYVTFKNAWNLLYIISFMIWNMARVKFLKIDDQRQWKNERIYMIICSYLFEWCINHVLTRKREEDEIAEFGNKIWS